MPDVEIRFLGDADEAEGSVTDLRRCFELLDELLHRVQGALRDITIPASTTARFVAESKVMERSLEDIEDQANDTKRALDRMGLPRVGGAALAGFHDLGPSTMLAAFARGMPFVPGDPRSGVSPLTSVSSNRYFGGNALNSAMSGHQDPVREWMRVQGFNTSAVHDQTTAERANTAALLIASRSGSGGGGGGGAGTAGLLAALGLGHGGGGGALANMPGWAGYFGRIFGGLPFGRLGSPLGLAGFGVERFLGTALGITGSIAGAAGGGALYGAGILGPMAVGMGTDMAGIGQAAGDIKNVTQGLNALSQAQAQYGKNSIEAKNAQAQLNLTLQGFSPVARRAVLDAAQTGIHFKAMFDKLTGPAERVGAQIINTGMQTGEKFLPTLGQFAYGNMRIIQKSLESQGGLFQWLKQPSGGLGIFTDLETIFQKRLPTAMHAGTQAFEVFLHVIDDAAHRTGGFLTGIDKLFTRLNTPAGLKSVNHEVGTLIGLFETWLHLLTSVGGLMFDLFKPAVGLGQDFAKQLTRIVNLTRDWLHQPGTQNVLHQLFEAHRQQLDAIFQVIRALWPVLESTISAFAQIEAVVTKLTIGPLKLLAQLISSITSHPLADKILGWAGALLIVNRGLGTMLGYLRALIIRWGVTGAAAATSAAETDAALATEDAALATTTTNVGILGGAISALGGEALLARLAALRASFVGLLGPIGAALLAVYALDKAIAKLTGFDALKRVWGSAGFGADNTASDKMKGHDPFPVGSSDYTTWLAGYRGLHPGQKVPDGAGHMVTITKAMTGSNAYKQGVKASHSGHGAGGRHGKTAPDGASVDWHQFVGHHKGEDCSLFTQRVYKEVWNISIPRTSEEQWKGGYAASGNEVGDLLFYNGHNEFKPPGHVALYIGHGQLIQDNGSGTVQIMDVGALDSLGYMGSKTYRKVNAIGTGGSTGYNPGGKGSGVGSGSTRVTRASTTPHPALASKASIFSAISDAQGALAQINHALHDSFAKLAGVTTRFSPDTLMGAHPLAKAEAHWDPLLKAWRKQLLNLEDELHKHGLTAKMEAEIRARIDRIKNHIVGAFDAIRRAAQTQFAAATQAWSAFIQQFDSQYQQGTSTAADQLAAAKTKLGQLAQAVAIDKAQAAVLGGKADPSMAQTVISQMQTVLATPGGKPQPYTQQQIDNWLQIWGAYYASKGYTPEQMYKAFNKLLKSVGLPEIDNPFDTGGLPLPPDARGTLPAGTVVPAGPRPGDSDYVYPGDTGGGGGHGGHGGGRGRHPHHRHHHHHRHRVHIRHGGHPHAAGVSNSGMVGGGSSSTSVEIHIGDGMQWLDKHITTIVDGEIVKQGKKANARARSGRH